MCPTGATNIITHPPVPARHAATQRTRLDIPQLEDAVSSYLAGALAPATLRVYGSGRRRYMAFCSAADISPLPLVEHALCMFVTYLARDGLTHQTIKSYLSAIRHYHILAGQGDPFIGNPFPLLQYVLRGIKRSPVHSRRLPRMPITPTILRAPKDQWATASLRDTDFVMLWAACCMGFFGFMRAGEFSVTHVSEFDPASSLCLGDIAVDRHQDPSVVQVRLKQSKTDPFHRGVSIYLGRTQTDLCPVVAILAYIAVRPAVNGPLFVFKDGSFLTRDRLVSAIRRALSAAGINTTGFSGHSFWIGAATTAAVVGVEDSTIKMLGRWESSAYQRYLRTPRETLAAISARLVTP